MTRSGNTDVNTGIMMRKNALNNLLCCARKSRTWREKKKLRGRMDIKMWRHSCFWSNYGMEKNRGMKGKHKTVKIKEGGG